MGMTAREKAEWLAFLVLFLAIPFVLVLIAPQGEIR